MKKYIIEDWAGNRCFVDKTFKSQEDAHEFICELFGYLPEDQFNETVGEFYVEQEGTQ